MVTIMRVLFLNRYSSSGASSRLRVLQYIPYYKSIGFDVEVRALFDENYLHDLYLSKRRSRVRVAQLYYKRLLHILSVWKYDLIWIEKELFPYAPALFERLLCLLGKPYVVEYDDAIFHNYDRSKNWFVRKFLNSKIDVVMKNSACVVAGNKYIADRARNACAPRVVTVPTVIDITRYGCGARLENTPFTIGWIGTPSTEKYIIDIWPSLRKACADYGAKIILVGADPEVVKDLGGGNVEVLSWSEESEVELIKQFDIGIMPLQDGPWERGKCGYKLIQYMGCGVPVIASPVGVNVDIVTGSSCGLLASSLIEWDKAIAELYGSPIARRDKGLAGRRAVEDIYSVSIQAPILGSIINSTAVNKRVS